MTAAARRTAIALLALFALLIIVEAPALDGPYLWDDHVLAEHDELDPAPVSKVLVSPFFTADALRDARPRYFRPLTTLSLRADRAVLGAGPLGHHFVNIGLHAIAAILLVVFARRLGSSPVAAVLAGTTWALAPRLTEAVCWISGRPELLAGVLSFAALAAWPWLPGRPVPRHEAPRAVVSLLLLFGALLSKEVAVASVLALAVATLLATGTRTERARRLGAIALPLALYGVLRTIALASEPGESAALSGLGTVLEATGRYVAMALDPWHAASSIGLVGEVDARFAILGAVSLALGSALAVRLWMRRATVSRPALVAATLGLAGLAPALRIVPFSLASAVAADRLLYLPLAGLALVLAVLAGSLPARARVPASVAAAVLAVSLAFVSRARSQLYADELQFWLAATEHAHPHNTAPRSALANTVRALGVPEIACALHASSLRILGRSGRTGTSRYLRAVENLASCDALVGRTDEAMALFRGVLASKPDSGRVHMGLGFALLQTMAFDDAEASFRRAVALEPSLTTAKDALELLATNRRTAARLATAEARDRDPLGWARLTMRLGRVADADRAWLAIAMDPEAPPDVFHEAIAGLLAVDDAAGARRALARETPVSDELRRDTTLVETKHARVAAVSGVLDTLAAQ